MEAGSSCTQNYEVDMQELDGLLEAFGSCFSLKDITSAYFQADKNVEMAGEVLCSLQGSISRTATPVAGHNSEGESGTTTEFIDGRTVASSKVSHDSTFQKSSAVKSKFGSKSKKNSAYMGTVSGVIGKEYANPKPSPRVFSPMPKPLKVYSEEFPMSEICNGEAQPSMDKKCCTMHNDVAEFMYEMLGDGFQLGMNVIQEVLGHCGYDTQKSMKKLLELSASTLQKSDDVVGIASQKLSEKSPNLKSFLRHEQSGQLHSAKSYESEFVSPRKGKDVYSLQKEVLGAVFSVPERIEEKPKKWRPLKERRTFGTAVLEPLKDSILEYNNVISEPKDSSTVGITDEDDRDSYEALRKSVKEYWITMTEYYKAAVNAFAMGDRARATRLIEQGSFFRKKLENQMINLLK